MTVAALAVVVNLYALWLMAIIADWARDNHGQRRWNYTTWTMLALVGGWEILLGAFLMSMGAYVAGVGPVGLGLSLLAVAATRAHVRRKLGLTKR